MIRKLALFVIVASLLITAVPALAGGGPGTPNFGEAIFADGQAFGTKGLGALPAPNGHNEQAFDKLFTWTGVTAEGQLAVAEAAPGNPAYNGGRWSQQVVAWTEAGLAAHGGPVLLKSYGEIMLHYGLGHLTIEDAHNYFECPLLPVH